MIEISDDRQHIRISALSKESTEDGILGYVDNSGSHILKAINA
jgi:hypothetical protein